MQLPAKLMTLAEREHRPSRAARLAQMAGAIEILLMAPIRFKYLCGLDLERHLIRPSRGSETLHLVFDASEAKNSEPLEFPSAAEQL